MKVNDLDKLYVVKEPNYKYFSHCGLALASLICI